MHLCMIACIARGTENLPPLLRGCWRQCWRPPLVVCTHLGVHGRLRTEGFLGSKMHKMSSLVGRLSIDKETETQGG